MEQHKQLAEIQELLDSACGPMAAMFVGERSFRHIATFLNGYLAGRCYGTALNLSQYLQLFGVWMAKRFSKPPETGWERVVMEVCNGIDELALDNAPRLFCEFREECGEFDRKQWFARFGPWMRSWKEKPYYPLPYLSSSE